METLGESMAEQDESLLFGFEPLENNAKIYSFVEELLMKLFRSVSHSQPATDGKR